MAYAAGILSSRVQLESDEVLAQGGECGFPGMEVGHAIDYPDFEFLVKAGDGDVQAMQSEWGRWIGSRSLEYVRNCYIAEGPVNEGMCNVFTTPNITFSTYNKATCPFSDAMCAQDHAIEVDTGYVDSNDHL